jgi:hypothetical protein
MVSWQGKPSQNKTARSNWAPGEFHEARLFSIVRSHNGNIINEVQNHDLILWTAVDKIASNIK